MIDTGEKVLHPLRRRRLRGRLAREPVESVLFVCLGNICRSPYAERRLRAELNGHVPKVLSAGFIRPGRPSPDTALRIAGDRGIDLAGHRSRLVSKEALEHADIVFVMSGLQRRRLRRGFGRVERVYLLGDLDPNTVDRRAIQDPFDRADDVYASVFERIDRCCRAFAATHDLSQPGAN